MKQGIVKVQEKNLEEYLQNILSRFFIFLQIKKRVLNNIQNLLNITKQRKKIKLVLFVTFFCYAYRRFLLLAFHWLTKVTKTCIVWGL